MKKILKKFKKRLIGAAVTIAVGGSSLVFTYTADGCNVEYQPVRDRDGILTPVDKDGQTIQGKF